MIPLLELNNVVKTFDGQRVIDNLTLHLQSRDVFGLVGRSGCGKSTVLKLLIGYYTADKGSVVYQGKDITKKPSVLRNLIGYTAQENSFYDKLTILENMQYYGNLYNVATTALMQRVDLLLGWIRLSDHKHKLAGSISGGMKRRLDFALSLIHKPKIVILDEPTTGLDPVLIETFWDIVKKTAYQDHITVIITSHILSEIESHCSTIGIMSRGKIAHTQKISAHTNLVELFRKHAK